MSQPPTNSVAMGTVVAYGVPAIGAGYMMILLSLYVGKFATDVLLIAPGVIGLIFGISRIWDAISDPLAGYLSDKTKLDFGRRRTWMVGSLLPISIFFLMVFSPPQSLTGGLLTAWMAVAIIGFYSALTALYVPHMALGAELSSDYHERTRLFGVRHAAYYFGSILSLVAMYYLIQAEIGGYVRDIAWQQALLAVVVTAIVVLIAVSRLSEDSTNVLSSQSNPWRAFGDVMRNRYARLLYLVWFIESVGGAAIGALTLYVTQYVVGAPQLAPWIIFAYMLPTVLSVPLWLKLSKRFGKVPTWCCAMCGTALSFGGMFLLLFIDTVDARLWLIFTLAFTAGFSAGGGGSIGPSVQSDVIDYDELLTGERKEGSYFAVWNFLHKSAIGVMLMLTGFTLQFTGFVANEEQTQLVKIGMLSLYGLFPLVCYLVGAAMFYRFELDEKAHAEIKQSLVANSA